MTFRVESDLRESFLAYAKSIDRSASQLLRDFMRSIVDARHADEDERIKKMVETRVAELKSGKAILVSEEDADARIDELIAALKLQSNPQKTKR